MLVSEKRHDSACDWSNPLQRFHLNSQDHQRTDTPATAARYDGSSCAHSLSVVAFAEKAVDATHGELQSCSG